MNVVTKGEAVRMPSDRDTTRSGTKALAIM